MTEVTQKHDFSLVFVTRTGTVDLNGYDRRHRGFLLANPLTDRHSMVSPECPLPCEKGQSREVPAMVQQSGAETKEYCMFSADQTSASAAICRFAQIVSRPPLQPAEPESTMNWPAATLRVKHGVLRTPPGTPPWQFSFFTVHESLGYTIDVDLKETVSGPTRNR
jgi:hypothetical protein